jgi:hypothetical protein
MVQNVTVYQNSATSTPGVGTNKLTGLYIYGEPAQSVAGGSSDITFNSCLVQGNSINTNGSIQGILIDGTGSGTLAGGCNNLSFNACGVTRNSGVSASDGFQVVGATGAIAGAKNLQFVECFANQNTSSSSTCNGFDIANNFNSTWYQCASKVNTSHGFLLSNVANSSFEQCKAFGNGLDGFDLATTTSKITIIGCQAMQNGQNGFDFASTTTICYTVDSIAQSNNVTGFNNGNSLGNVFVGNISQGNKSKPYAGVTITVPVIVSGAVTATSNTYH